MKYLLLSEHKIKENREEFFRWYLSQPRAIRKKIHERLMRNMWFGGKPPNAEVLGRNGANSAGR